MVAIQRQQAARLRWVDAAYDADCAAELAAQAVSRRSGWAHLPEPLGDLVRTIGGPMRNSVWDAELTTQLAATPEQLLARLRVEH